MKIQINRVLLRLYYAITTKPITDMVTNVVMFKRIKVLGPRQRIASVTQKRA